MSVPHLISVTLFLVFDTYSFCRTILYFRNLTTLNKQQTHENPYIFTTKFDFIFILTKFTYHIKGLSEINLSIFERIAFFLVTTAIILLTDVHRTID